MAFDVTPEIYLYRHQRGTSPSLSFLVEISDSQFWYLFNDPKMVFTIEGELKPEHNGAGNVSVNIGLANAVNDLDFGLHELNIRVLSNSGEEKSVQFFLILTESASNTVFPNTMKFEAIKNVQAADPQKIFIASTTFSGITLPSFLQIISNDAYSTGRIITIEPKHFLETPLPNYSGEITIEFGSSTKKIPVDYKIKSGYDEAFSKSVHFTRDKDELIFYKTINETTFLRLMANIKVFGYDGTLNEEIQIPFDLPFVENRAKLNIGKEIESYIQIFKEPFGRNNRVNAAYPPVEVNMTATELRYSDFSIVNQDMIPTQLFLKGRNPLIGNYVNQSFWLANRPNSLRYVTENTIIFLQVFKAANEPIRGIKVYRNGSQVLSLDPGTNGFSFINPYFLHASLRVQSVPGVRTGDLISFEYEGISIQRDFVVKNHAPNSFHVAFQTDWETMEILEFTGSAEFSVDYTHDTSSTMRNYVEVLNKIETENPQKLILNTGWIYKSEAYLFHELIRSKKAFMLPNQFVSIGANQLYESEFYGNIELIPVQSRIINHQSNENKVSFDIEFEINKRHEDEIYSR